MRNEIVVAQGLFSKLTITLKDDTVQKLAFIPKKDNPLAHIEYKMKELLNEFEQTYFDYTHPKKEATEEGSGTPQPSEHSGSSELAQPAPSKEKEKE